jgi:CHAT domain-containing protein
LKETESVYRWFRGERFAGNLATEKNFRSLQSNSAALHLAMHTVSDMNNSMYSYLIFDTQNDTLNDGRLYNYEISLMRLRSRMVVLSSCNTGTGTLYNSEGIMSLARSFVLAGASSVIMTGWEVNDEVSGAIMERFYYYLSKGRRKNEAMHLAKLEFLKNNPPSLKSPYYWAAYKVIGDTKAVVFKKDILVIIIGISIMTVVFILLLYFRRRRIF